MSAHEVATLISLATTAPTVILGLTVVILFGPDFCESACRRVKRRSDYLIMGIFLGFVGGVLDNVYWSFPWAADYLDLESADILMGSGVYFNIFSRQICGSAAAFFHIQAAFADNDTTRLTQVTNKAQRWVWAMLYLSCIVGVVMTAVLYVLKHYVLVSN